LRGSDRLDKPLVTRAAAAAVHPRALQDTRLVGRRQRGPIVADVVAATVAVLGAPALGGAGYRARGFGIMTHLPGSAPSRRSMWKPVVGMVIRVTVSATALLAAYYLVPTKGTAEDSDLPWLILELAIFGVVVAIQVPTIVKAKYPKLRAIEALAVTVPLFLLIFSRSYLSNSLTDPAAFTSPLDNTTALYSP